MTTEEVQKHKTPATSQSAYNAAYYAANREKIAATRAARYAANKEKILATRADYYAANREKVRIRGIAYRAANHEKIRAAQRDYRKANRKKANAYNKRYYRHRAKTDPLYRVAYSLRSRLLIAFKEQGADKSQPAFKLIGCTKEELRQHLVSQFREGMTLGNHGKVWHIDHIRPCSSFDLSDPNQAILCFHYSNLQPLFADENWRKGHRWEPTERRPLAA